MEIIRINSKENLESYGQEWSLILEEKNNSNPFIEFEWISKWLEHFGDEVNLEIIIVVQEEKPIAFVPFCYKKKGSSYIYNFIAFGQANYMDFVVSEGNTEKVVAFVFDEIIKFRKNVLFNLHGILESGKTATHIEEYLKRKNIKVRSFPVVTPFVNLEGLDLDQYLKNRNKLHGLDRRERRLRTLGEVELLPGSAEEMEYMFYLHNQRWGHRNDTSGFTDKKKRTFFQQLAHINSGAMRVQIEALYLENKMIAFTYGLSCRGRYMGYVLGHDHNFDFFSPGRILVKEKIKKSVESPVKLLDMSIGHEPYKTDWKTDLDYTVRLVFSTKSVKITLARNILWSKLALAASVKKHRWAVLLKRNTMGNVKYVFQNIWSLEGFSKIRPFLIKNLNSSRLFIYDSQTYYVYKKEVDLLGSSLSAPSFTEMTVKKVFNDFHLKEVNMKEVGRNLYSSYKGYYMVDKNSYKNLFWLNQNIIRIDCVSYIDQLKKKSVYIDKWNADNLQDVCTFVNQNNKPRIIFASVNSNIKKDIDALKKMGFKVEKKISKRTYLGFNRSAVKDYQNEVG